jgi:hypothetical protein
MGAPKTTYLMISMRLGGKLENLRRERGAVMRKMEGV